MRPPQFSHQTASPNLASMQVDVESSLNFTKNRKRTKRCASVLMYMGYVIIVLDILGIIAVLMEMVGAGQHGRMVKRRRKRADMMENPEGAPKH